MKEFLLQASLFLLISTRQAESFYLPGIAPRNFDAGEKVELKVNKLTSVHTQLSKDYYGMPFCRPPDGIQMYAENLGEFLSGDRIENSPYEIYMEHSENCKVLCQQTLSVADVMNFHTVIRNQYRHNWIVDNLPAASITEVSNNLVTSYSQGFLVGFLENGVYYLNNHVRLIIDYHPMDTSDAPPARVVGFYVQPFSVHHQFVNGEEWDGNFDQIPELKTCTVDGGLESISSSAAKQEVRPNEPFLFTYDIVWRESNVKWASRWDIYLNMDDSVPSQVHWFSILNSLLIVVFLSAMIGMILVRNLHRDIMNYNRVPTDEEKVEEREESGWKLVHADVFRAPTQYPMMFCILVGTGLQLVFSGLTTIIFAAIGFLSPANRGSLMVAVLLLFVLFGGASGYGSARLYKTFKGTKYKQCTTLTALFYPGICLLVFLVLDLVSWHYGSTQAIPVPSFLALLLLWIGVSLPLVFVGAYFGYKRPSIDYPVETSNIPREIPFQQWYMSPNISSVFGGILPFGAVFVEMFFILSSMWMGQYYYVFGFLFLVFLILLATCSNVSMVFVYFQLCSEDYHWWWRSFLTAGSTALYIFLYSAIYFSNLESNMFVTYMLYFGYMGIVCLGIFMLCGSIGFLSCLWFTKKIYSSIKVD